MKRFLLTLTAIICIVVQAFADKSGTCGVYATWVLNERTGILTISGSGGVEDFSFDNNISIKQVVIKDGITSIGSHAFFYCSSLTNITIPNSVTSIRNCAFYRCSGLTSVTIGSGVTSIGDDAFFECYSLTSITIPNSVTSIGNSAFEGCTRLTSVTIGSGVTSIGNRAFEGCWLTSINIPNSVTSIGDYAFYGCPNLTSITIPNSVTSIGNSAFDGCSRLKKVNISDIAAWCNISFGSCATPLSNVHHLYVNDKEVTDLVIPNSVTSIGDYAFYGCSGLTSVTIPNSVTCIGTAAFGKCDGLSSIASESLIPPTLGSSVFSACGTLHVSPLAIEAYQNAKDWEKFTIVGDLPILATSITLSENTISIPEAVTTTLTATIAPEEVNNKNIIWTSSNEDVAVVSNGTILGVAPGTAIITATAADRIVVKATCEVIVKSPTTPEILQSIDLGLPSGTLWANMNIGATSPEGYGDYFAWGETSPKETYSNANYKWYINGNNKQIFKYCTDSSQGTVDNKTTLAAADDAATVNWGSTWKTPSPTQYQEILDYCSCENATINGTNGLLVTGPNGNTLFFPYAGYMTSSGITNAGAKMIYWANQLNTELNPSASQVTSSGSAFTLGLNGGRGMGRTVRAVSTNTATRVPSIILNKSSLSIIEGETLFLTATVAPANATNKNVTWTSSNENVATVSNGTITAVAPGSATITATAADGSGVKATCEVRVKSPITPENSQLVDLGLPSGTLWAKMNVGATSPEGYGDYFAWGETSPKETYSNANYKWYINGNNKQIFKYCTDSSQGTVDNRTILAAADDAATVNWGSTWKTPSPEQYQEILDYCSCENATINGTNGLLVTGPNGNTLFFPYAGYMSSSGITNAGTKMIYWANQLNTELNHSACQITSTGSAFTIGLNGGRGMGRNVRAVSTNTATHVSSITLDRDAISISEGQVAVLTASIAPENATNKAIVWTTSNEEVATVSNGTITAVAPGSATITATAADGSGVKATCVVTVEPASSSDLNNAENYLTIADLTATPNSQIVLPILMTNSDQIAAFQADLYLPTGITLAEDEFGDGLIEFASDRTTAKRHTVSYKLQPDGAIRIVVLSFDNNVFSGTTGAVVNVTLDVANNIDTGDYTIMLNNHELTKTDLTAYKTTTKTATITVTPSNTLVSGITLNETALSIMAGQTASLIATVTPINATNKAITWTSSNEDVTTVENGVITAIAPGTATITATATDGSGVKAICEVTVEPLFTLGDVNGDGNISVTDAVAVVNFILGNNVEGLSREAADVNGDGEITVTDEVGVVNMILNSEGSSASSKAFADEPTSDLLTIGNVIVEENNNVRVMIKSLEDDITASQFDIVLPAGIVLEDITAADRRHSVSYNDNNGIIKVVCYSFNNDLFRSGNIAELCLKVVSDDAVSIDFSNIELTRPDLSNVCAKSQSLNADSLTGIKGNYHSSTKTKEAYDFNGRKVKDSIRKGTYIINGKKVKL